jgi:hypothetical protein
MKTCTENKHRQKVEKINFYIVLVIIFKLAKNKKLFKSFLIYARYLKNK